MKRREIWQLADERQLSHPNPPPETDDERDWFIEAAEELADAWNYMKYQQARSSLPEGAFWPIKNALQNAWKELRGLERRQGDTP